MIALSDVSACLVTRGDVAMEPIIESLAGVGEIVIYNNSVEADFGVYGRFEAATRATRPVVLFQDDDVILPKSSLLALCATYQPDTVVANMPERFRHDFYRDHTLLGFGSVMDRGLPSVAFDLATPLWYREDFARTCDIVATYQVPRILVDVPYTDREFASAPNRMWKQEAHVRERSEMLRLVREVRNAS